MSSVDNLSSSELHQLHTLLNNYTDVISLHEGDLGRTNLVRHVIDTQELLRHHIDYLFITGRRLSSCLIRY